MKNISIAVLLLVVAMPLGAQEETDERRPKHRKAPPIAYEVCAVAIEGDPCSFEGRRAEHVVDGTCEAREEALVCKPSSPPPPREPRDAFADEPEA